MFSKWLPKTKADLIAEWLQRYPEDFMHPWLGQMSIAGHVESRDGTFTPFTECQASKRWRWCDQCTDYVKDDDCPHWDYETESP